MKHVPRGAARSRKLRMMSALKRAAHVEVLSLRVHTGGQAAL